MIKNTCPPLGVKSIPVVLLAIGFLSAGFAQAQQSANASGGDATGSGGSAAYSVGQVVYTANNSPSGTVSQGVQQAYEIYSVGIKETELNISLSVFPNPTSDYLTIKVQNYNNEALSYNFIDEQGKLVLNEQITTHDTHVAMSTLARGAYFINVLQANKKIQSFKIIKN